MAIDRISAEALALLPQGDGSSRRFLMLGRQHLMLTAAERREIAERTSRLFDPALIDGLEVGAMPSHFCVCLETMKSIQWI